MLEIRAQASKRINPADTEGTKQIKYFTTLTFPGCTALLLVVPLVLVVPLSGPLTKLHKAQHTARHYTQHRLV